MMGYEALAKYSKQPPKKSLIAKLCFLFQRKKKEKIRINTNEVYIFKDEEA